MKGGIYQVYSTCPLEEKYAGKVKVAISINELHQNLGHVSHERAKMLAIKGLVEGVELDLESKLTVCKSCEWAKGERKAIVKIREGKCTAGIGKEIHSDLWGPAPVKTINHKLYYISFTDDFSRFTLSISFIPKMKPLNPTRHMKAPFLAHSCSIPTSFLLHSYIIPAPLLAHSYIIPGPFLTHSHIIPGLFQHHS